MHILIELAEGLLWFSLGFLTRMAITSLKARKTR